MEKTPDTQGIRAFGYTFFRFSRGRIWNHAWGNDYRADTDGAGQLQGGQDICRCFQNHAVHGRGDAAIHRSTGHQRQDAGDMIHDGRQHPMVGKETGEGCCCKGCQQGSQKGGAAVMQHQLINQPAKGSGQPAEGNLSSGGIADDGIAHAGNECDEGVYQIIKKFLIHSLTSDLRTYGKSPKQWRRRQQWSRH